MPITEKELKILKRIEERGGQVDWKAFDRKFGIGTFGMLTLDVDFSIFDQVREIINELIDKNEFTCELSRILFSPMILRGDGLVKTDFIKHNRKEKVFRIGKNIDYEIWQKSRTPNRIKLAEEFFKSTTTSIPDRNMSPQNKTTFISIVDSAFSRMKQA